MNLFFKSLLLFTILVGHNVSANQCSNWAPWLNNSLITKSFNLSDSSPFFIKNDLSSFKFGQYDIDANEFNVNSYGNKLGLTGNTWKTVKLNNYFVVNENSYLEFQFLSNGDEAEINGVGLMLYGSSGFHSDRFFQVYGTQTAHNQDFHNYSGNQWVTYRIPLWQYFQNTGNKVIEKLIFAADDDNQQVNQSVYYKNVRLIENYTEYSLPASFEHGPVIVQPTANKKFFHHIYPQVITGPDNNIYPVSGGSIVKKVYSPPNSTIEETIYVKENYYANACWEQGQGINFDSNTLATNSMNSLQAIVNDPEANIETFRNQQPVVLTQTNTMYFDPDAEINGQTEPRFVNKSRIFSNQSLAYFFEEREAGQNTNLNSGFVTNQANCSNPGTGQNTQNVCFNLTGLTTFNANTNKYLADSNLTSVHEDLRTATNPSPISQLVEDSDNKWSEDDLKKQTTELLINTQHFNNYLASLNPNSNFQHYTGYKPQSLINSVRTPNAAFNPNTNKVYFSPPGIMRSGKPVTYSRDVGVVAHEYTHAISYEFFNGQLSEGTMEGCAINEGFSDIIGYGTKYHAYNLYTPGFAVDIFDNNDEPYGIRNAANPLLTGGHSVFVGSVNQTKNCRSTYYPPGEPCPPWNDNCDFNPIPIGEHKQATIITHLYHLMVTGGFNADPSFRPEPFGVSSDETFSHKAAERLFFNAMSMGHGSTNSQGSDFTYCNLRNNMLQATNNDTDKVKINQAWKQVYEDLETDCPLPIGFSLLKPTMEIVKLDDNSTIGMDGNIGFGYVNAGFNRTIDLQINNTGDYPLRLVNPNIDSTYFTQFGISSQPLTIGVGESTTIQVKFNASSNNVGLNQGVLTFETNHPDYETFTINLSGSSISNNPDAFEEDDSPTSPNIYKFGFTESTIQNRNFEDDSFDWFSYSNLAIGCAPPEAYACKFKFTELNSPMNISGDKYNPNLPLVNIVLNQEYIIFGGKGQKFLFYNYSSNTPQSNSDYTVEVDCGCY
ncbi:MAG: hypothetical protein ACK5L8_05955 [Marinicella pacifica]